MYAILAAVHSGRGSLGDAAPPALTIPDAKIGIISCGGGIVNPCLTLAQSGWSTLFKIPVAAYGLLWYLLAMFIVLIADYAGGRYHAYCLAVILPLAAVAVAADVVLAVILIITKLFCTFCIATYAVNIGILAVAILWFRKAMKDEQFSLRRDRARARVGERRRRRTGRRFIRPSSCSCSSSASPYSRPHIS